MVGDGRGGRRATGLDGDFNQPLVKTEASAGCVTALTRVSGGPSAFLFCLTRGGGQGAPRQARSREPFPAGRINAKPACHDS